jgi:hypothetical protein
VQGIPAAVPTLVAVAVMNGLPATAVYATMKAALPAPSVVTNVAATNRSPSPNPLGSATALAKNSRRNRWLGMLLRVPVMVPPLAEVSTG